MLKVFNLLIISGLLAITSHATPVRDRISSDAEFVVVPLTRHVGMIGGSGSFNIPIPGAVADTTFDNFDGVIDTDDFEDDGYFPSFNPFSWHFNSFLEDSLKTLRDRLAGSWMFHDGLPSDMNKEGNSTSVVKVVDGHKVIINDTFYTKNDDFGTSVYKIRIIDVQPLDDENTDKNGAPEAGENGEDFDDEDKKTSVEQRNGGDGDIDGLSTPKRDTELESDEESTSETASKRNDIDRENDIDSSVGPDAERYSGYGAEVQDLLYGQQYRPNGPASLEDVSAEITRQEDILLAQFDSQEDKRQQEEEEEEENRKRIITYNRFDDRYANKYNNYNYNVVEDNRQVSQPPVSLSDDVRVNQLLADRGVMINPESEYISAMPQQPAQFPQPNPQFPPQQDPQFTNPQFPSQRPIFTPQDQGFPQANPMFPQFPAQRPQFPQFPVQRPAANPQFPQSNPGAMRPQSQFPQQTPQFPQQSPQVPRPQSQFPQFPQQNPQFPQQNPQFPQQNPQFPQQRPNFSLFPQFQPFPFPFFRDIKRK